MTLYMKILSRTFWDQKLKKHHADFGVRKTGQNSEYKNGHIGLKLANSDDFDTLHLIRDLYYTYFGLLFLKLP